MSFPPELDIYEDKAPDGTTVFVVYVVPVPRLVAFTSRLVAIAFIADIMRKCTIDKTFEAQSCCDPAFTGDLTLEKPPADNNYYDLYDAKSFDFARKRRITFVGRNGRVFVKIIPVPQPPVLQSPVPQPGD